MLTSTLPLVGITVGSSMAAAMASRSRVRSALLITTSGSGDREAQLGGDLPQRSTTTGQEQDQRQVEGTGS